VEFWCVTYCLLEKHHKKRNSVHFRRPKTEIHGRKPKYPRKASSGHRATDEFDVIRFPVTSESAMQKVENLNTLVFIVDRNANKPTIKHVFETLYKVKVRKINTLITFDFYCLLLYFMFCFFNVINVNSPLGQKKAFIRLSPEFEAVDVASKVGVL
jgi:large subunit ribosomal protein L23Ae